MGTTMAAVLPRARPVDSALNRHLHAAGADITLSASEERRVKAALQDVARTRAAAVAFSRYSSDDAGGGSRNDTLGALSEDVDTILRDTVQARLTDALGPARALAAARHLLPLTENLADDDAIDDPRR